MNAFGKILTFPDQSKSFVHGFEAGTTFNILVQEVAYYEPPFGLHEANRDLFKAMAERLGYYMVAKDYDATYFLAQFYKKPPLN